LAAALAVAGCGGGSSSKSTSSSPSSAAPSSAAPTSAQAKRAVDTGDLSGVFAPIAGYEMSELPADVLSQARQQYQSEVSGNAIAKQAVTDLQGRKVTKGGDPVAVVLALSFDKGLAAVPGFQDGFVKGAAGDNATPQTVSGESVYPYTDSDGTKGVAFGKGDLGLIVVGSGDPNGDLTDVMGKLIANNV
jgi:hypothetical protein